MTEHESPIQTEFVRELNSVVYNVKTEVALDIFTYADFDSSKCNQVVISTSSKIARKVVQLCPKSQHVFTLIDSESYLTLQEELKKKLPELNSRAIVVDQPSVRIINKALNLVDTSPLLVLVTKSQASVLKTSLPKKILDSINIVLVNNEEDVLPLAKKHLPKNRGLIALPNKKIWTPNNAKWLLYLAYQHRLPVVGFSAAFTRAGAVMSVFATPKQLAEDTADVILNLYGNKEQKIIYSRQYTIDINESVLKVLRLPKSAIKKVRESKK